MDILEKVTAEANYLQLKGDIEFKRKNYMEAHKYYRQAYDHRMLYYTRMHLENSKIYKRLAKVLYYIGDNPCEYKFPNLTEAKLCVKRYIKIKKAQGKDSKDYIEFYFILGKYYNLKKKKKREKH